SLGILIGVLSVVLLIALGQGLKNFIEGQFESLGTNQIIVVPGKVLQGGGIRPGGGSLGGATFDEKDVLKLRKIHEITHIAPAFIKTVEVSTKENTELGDMFASTEDIFTVYSVEIGEGRAWTKTDVRKRSKVAVIGPTIEKKLFPQDSFPVGNNITIQNQRFRIIGIAESTGGGGFGGPDLDSFIYIPHTSATAFNPDKKFFAIYMRARSDKEIPKAQEQVRKILEDRYDEGDFSVLERDDILDVVTQIFSVLNSGLVTIGAISLIVGGIGIMNIMYVSVVERTREIGIRRAVGATKRDILLQFLAESVLLSLIGGIGGIALSILIVIVVHNYFPVSISLTSVIIAFIVSSAIGIIFGVFPARSAANLTPVEAIRYE
ncbi:MAG: ABC transporter permease, partial [Candidatus Paceibacterota bacterium]